MSEISTKISETPVKIPKPTSDKSKITTTATKTVSTSEKPIMIQKAQTTKTNNILDGCSVITLSTETLFNNNSSTTLAFSKNSLETIERVL